MSTQQNFDDLLEVIIRKLEEKKKCMNISEDVEIVHGIFNVLGGEKYSENTVLGGISIPSIVLLGKASGRLYFFSLKSLLKES